MRGNDTRNQHFVSQVELGLNASNPNSTDGNFRIYSFRIADREAYRIELENPRGRAIASTLSMLDLFSFDVSGGGPLRMNLEALFHKYEANVAIHTKGLLEKLAAGSADMAMSFNLCSTAFVDYVFADATTLVEGRAVPAFVANALAAWRQRPEATINVTVTKSNRPMLARYNRRIIEQARERVYCAEKAGIVLA